MTDSMQNNQPESRSHRRTADGLMLVVYDELRRLAQRMLTDEPANITLQATALVNEAYIRLADQTRAVWADELHFVAVASQIIRRILVDHARHRKRIKRGGDRQRILLDPSALVDDSNGVDILELNELLEVLATSDDRAARVVELRFFGGLTNEQVARQLDVSSATVDRDWRFARAWLLHRLNSDRSQPPVTDHER